VKFWFYIVFFSISFGNFSGFSQDEVKLIANDTITTPIDPLRPSKAAFFSALLPGAGQAYNKSYWKIPIVYAAMGTSIYAYSWNQKKYNSFRDEYKKRLANDPNLNPEYERLSDDRLIQAQKFHQRNRDLSMLVTAAFYILNIVDANVEAHLQQFNVNGKLTVRPDIQTNDFTNQQNVGLALNFKF
jgi:Family of unknown function (DUF5683)